MSATLESIEVELRLSREQFSKELSQVQNQLSGLTGITKSTGNAVGSNLVGSLIKGNIATQILLGSVKKLANGVFGLSKQVMMSGSSLARMRVATNTLARNLGITQEELDGLRDSLAESNTYGINAERTIKTLAMSGLVDMARSLKTVDARSGETMTGINALVLTMKDLSAIAGLASDVGMERITTFINRGQAQAVDGMIAIGNMGAEYRDYAKTLGKSRNQLTAVEEAQARMNLVMREGKKALGAYADAYTSSGKMIDSIGSTMRNIFDELGGALEPLWATVSTAILDFVQGVRNFLTDNIETIRAWATRVAGWVQWLVQTIGAWLSKLPRVGTYFQKLANFQVKSAKTGDGNAEAIYKQADAMEQGSKSASKLKKELAGLAKFDEMNVLKAPEEAGGGGGLGGGGLAEDQMPEGGGLLAGIDEAIQNFAKSVKEKMQPILDKIKEFFKPIADLWNAWVKPAFEGLMAVLKELWASIMESPIGDVLKVIGQIIGVVIVGAIAIFLTAITRLAALLKMFFDKWKKDWDKLGAWINTAKEGFRLFGEDMKAVWTVVSEWFRTKIEEIKKFFSDLTQAIPILWEYAKNWVMQKMIELTINILKKIIEISNKWQEFKSIIANVFQNIVDNARNKIQNVKDFFIGIYSTVVTVFNNIKSTIWNAISTVVDNIKNKINTLKLGFETLGNSIVTAVKAPINNIIDKINSFLRTIRSVKIPGIAPNGIQVPNIPRLATGGVIESPTYALLGEAGREVVMPLEKNTGWINELANAIGNRGGSGNMNLVVKIGEDKIFEKAIDYINDKSMRSGTNLLNI